MDYSGLDDDSDEQNEGGRALELKLSIGYNSAMRAAVHNLTIKRGEKKTNKRNFLSISSYWCNIQLSNM